MPKPSTFRGHHESIESIFMKICATFGFPEFDKEKKIWSRDNVGAKIPGAFWAIWRPGKDIIKEAGFSVKQSGILENHKVGYKIVFESTTQEVDFSSIVSDLAEKLRRLPTPP